ncbi:hypothetical protein [Sinomonas terrae]|uniref:Phosphodiesterase n=1 Tax=Sinomonas terrae TaxID=2908838 RepID=A0ABS9U3S5_9MICC|nr:hypothetical protein [Sinomonas terrae]MCH6471348.1 hypothetical protein [Sinomonas terrae]
MHPTDYFGQLFAAAFDVLKTYRPRRPIHPQGVLFKGSLERIGGGAASGIDFLDTTGTNAVTARLSRSLGVPISWPDIIGLAIRVHTDDGDADVLLASTGWRVPDRFALTCHRTAGAARLSSLMPYRGRKGAVLIGAKTTSADPGAPGRVRPDALWELDLFWAKPTGPWRRFGLLSLTPDLDAEGRVQDTALRFDPLLNVLPTAGTYEWTRRLREHSYRLARS